MATIDDLTSILASAIANTDVFYVGKPGDPDPDRQMTKAEMGKIFALLTGATFTGNLKITGGNYPALDLLSQLAGADNLRMFASATSMSLRNETEAQNTHEFLMNPAGSADIKVGGRSIAAYGSNSNGRYVRFYNGVQICWQDRSDVGNTATTATGSVYKAASVGWTFPQAFTAIPTITVGTEYRSEGDPMAMRIAGNATNTFCSFILYAATSGSNANFHAVAIGRWY